MFQNRSQNPLLTEKIKQLALPLAPLVQLSTGRAHPAFPQTLLAFHLLSEADLDSLAHFYHQSTPGLYTHHYPKSMQWRRGLRIDQKRRRLGLFIGLRGCESPTMMGMGEREAELLRERSEEEIWGEARREREVKRGF